MAKEGFKRKLAAILSADVAGYSRLMAEDETFTVKTITTYREVMTSLSNSIGFSVTGRGRSTLPFNHLLHFSFCC